MITFNTVCKSKTANQKLVINKQTAQIFYAGVHTKQKLQPNIELEDIYISWIQYCKSDFLTDTMIEVFEFGAKPLTPSQRKILKEATSALEDKVQHNLTWNDDHVEVELILEL